MRRASSVGGGQLHEPWNLAPKNLATLGSDERETTANADVTVIQCKGQGPGSDSNFSPFCVANKGAAPAGYVPVGVGPVKGVKQ